MPNINTPEKLKNEILSRLGSPLHTVEVTENQVWRCIDRAVQKFTEFHPDGTNRAYVVAMVSADEATSGVIQFATPFTAITNVQPIGTGSVSDWNQGSVYDALWHMGADILKDLQNGGCSGGANSVMVNYEVYEQFLELNKNMLYPSYDFHYNPLRKQLSIQATLVENQLLVIEGYIATTVPVEDSILAQSQVQSGGNQNFFDPTDHSGITAAGSPQQPASPVRYFTQESYNNYWLQDYATALVKYQWAQNLSKYAGQPLPGNITIDAKELKAEAKEEIKDLEDQLKKLEAPMEFFMA